MTQRSRQRRRRSGAAGAARGDLCPAAETAAAEQLPHRRRWRSGQERADVPSTAERGAGRGGCAGTARGPAVAGAGSSEGKAAAESKGQRKLLLFRRRPRKSGRREEKASLLYSSGGDMKKQSLGPPLIPPIGKVVRPPLGSAAGSLQSSPQLEFQESQERRPRYSSRSKEESSEHAGLPLSQAKEMDHHADPCLTSDTDLKEGFGKIRAALCTLAQKNLERKDAELLERETKKRRQRKTSLQPILETVEPGDEAEASFSLPPVDGTASRVQRKHPGSALKKKVLRKQDKVPLLPNRHIIHGGDSFPCSSSVTLQMATGAQCREEPLRGHGQKDRASPDPQQSLLEALSLLGSDDWEMKEKGLYNIKHLAGSHSEVLLCRLHDVCLAVTSEVTNLRSKVSYSTIVTLGKLFVTLKKNMDSEVDEVARVLLQTVSNSPEFVQKAASQTLGIMVENVTPARAMTALMDMGVKSRHAQVRKCGAELLLSLMERIGVTKLAGTARAERLAHVAGKLAQDCYQDTRYFGQEMVKMLLNHQKFKMLLEQSLSTHDLEDILTRIKKKGMENQKAERPSVKELVKKRNDGSKKPQATLSSSKRVKSTSDGRLLHRAQAQVTLPPAEEETELLQKLYNLLEAKGFQTRMEGVSLFQDLCKTSPQLISTNIVQCIFDYFVLRISDSHKKVKQRALDVLAEVTGILKDALNPVIIGLVEGITKNLNSKDPRIRAAAVKALEESIAHLGKAEPWHGLSSPVSLSVQHKRTLSALVAAVVCGKLQLASTRSCAGAILMHQSPNRLERDQHFPKVPGALGSVLPV
ncbi:TOG array regulator of axonemal microtubules protein 2-like [Passer domesticus]|uniref:TOG array regulator of axonemal microtubules protein 2-like n=1 Tax=Passer domesticus TaxID=48849 RepID=UPI0030FE90FF